MTDLTFEPDPGYFTGRGVTEVAADLRGGAVGVPSLVEDALIAAERAQPHTNAFTTLDPSGARADARRAEEELAAGVDRGPLHGIPVAVKDMIATAGLRTTMGSRHFADHVPTEDAECVRRLRAAGAIIIGKAMTHEFAYGPTGDRSISGPARNPRRLTHMAGGSSGGSAAAVASGVVPLALGTDTGGSVRIPAACCGVVGLRPTFGAVPDAGVYPLSPTLDAIGPIARSVADLRLLWHVLKALAGEAFTVEGRPPMRRPRIGWVRPEAFHPTTPAITEMVRSFVDNVAADVTDVVVPECGDLRRAYRVIQSSEVFALHDQRVAAAAELFDPEVLTRLRRAAEVRGYEYVAALAAKADAQAAVARLFSDYDLLALPTIPVTAPEVDARTCWIAGHEAGVPEALLSLTSPWSVLGVPSISLPVGELDGLPVALQLVAAPGAEVSLLDLSQWLSA